MSLQLGDKVRIVNDWLSDEAKSTIARLDNFQMYGKIKFAKVKWIGKNAKAIAEDCGDLFPLDEVKKI